MPVNQESELILTADKRVYHLNLKAQDIADDVILVGDPGRVAQVSALFSEIEFKTAHREFVTHTGTCRGKRITVLSTGIGPDNVDIVVNELDAAVNINPESRTLNTRTRSLRLIRLGTCGALQADLDVDSLVVSSHAVGLDGLMHYYSALSSLNEIEICEQFRAHTRWPANFASPYVISSSAGLLSHFHMAGINGITVTAPGFYAPQGRTIRLSPAIEDLPGLLQSFSYNGQRILNFEMESSALFGLGRALGHQAITICVVIANRIQKKFSDNYQQSVQKLITQSLEIICKQ